MRPRITKAQKVSWEEMEGNEGIQPRRSKDHSIVRSSGVYTYVFGRKVYLTKDELSRLDAGFTIERD